MPTAPSPLPRPRHPLPGRRAALSLLFLAPLAACGGGGGGGGGDTTPPGSEIGATIRNLFVAASEALAGDGFQLVLVSEAGQAGTDLNGDGDSNDKVLHVYDTTQGTLTNLELATTDILAIGAGHAAFLVRELDQGADLNGDGDFLDDVLHVHELGTANVTNLGIAAAPEFSIEGGRLVFLALESFQGVDLNGDGDTDDRVLHLHRVVNGSTTNLGLSVVGDPVRDGSLLAVLVREELPVDLNGDSDSNDLVLHTVDLETGILRNLELAVATVAAGDPGTVQVAAPYVSFFVFEGAQGEVDLNGDGVPDDRLLHLHHAVDGTTENLGLESAPTRLGPEFLALLLPETLLAEDLNGDGDILDLVLHVYLPATGELRNVGIAVLGFDLAGGHVVFSVLEAFQGEDLTGDGDLQDQVVHAYEVATGTLTNTHVAGLGLGEVFSARRIGFLGSEIGEGADLNGDGDVRTEDGVLHVLDLSTGEVRNLGFAVSSFTGNDRLIALNASEINQGQDDLNRDGDGFDQVLFVHVFASGLTGNMRNAVRLTGDSGRPIGLDGSTLLVRVSEFEQGAHDLNLDLDASDFVLHVVEVASPE